MTRVFNNNTRIIRMNWTQRNINRIHKWLRLESGWDGFLYRDGKCIGWKSASTGKKIAFCFD